ncbi:UNVERIFIED_CONTAM: hypothetical protein GTU68_048878 [Idotea baltica]|nr:hypothetical protein [Idotea baltica]
MFRTRKTGSRNFFEYISTFAMYAKTCNVILWFSLDPVKGVIYVVLVLVHLLVVGEPVYKGPENVVYFDVNGPEEELKMDKNTYWLITFYASWNPACGKLAPIFSKLSLEYSLPNLKFGKVDVGRYPEMAKKYYINDTSYSLQLPTIALYKGEKELMRRPCLDARGKFQKFYFTEDNIRAAYDLNNLFVDCKGKEEKGVKKGNRIKAE